MVLDIVTNGPQQPSPLEIDPCDSFQLQTLTMLSNMIFIQNSSNFSQKSNETEFLNTSKYPKAIGYSLSLWFQEPKRLRIEQAKIMFFFSWMNVLKNIVRYTWALVFAITVQSRLVYWASAAMVDLCKTLRKFIARCLLCASSDACMSVSHSPIDNQNVENKEFFFGQRGPLHYTSLHLTRRALQQCVQRQRCIK